MKTITTILSLLLFPLALVALDLQQHTAADEIYASRRGQELSSEELAIVGKWSAENREVVWEIERKRDGTYEIVIRGEFEGEKYIDYNRGIWGILNGSYYYAELETNYADFEFMNLPTYERVLDVSEGRFLTVMPGEYGEALESEERRVQKFRFEFWSEVNMAKK